MTIRNASSACLFVTLLLSVAAFRVRAADPAELVERMEQAMRGDSSYAEMTMTIERPRYTREISLRAWMLGRSHSLVLVTAPARDEGTAFLMHDSMIWNYDPRIDRTMRLPSSMMAQPWMGSDFTNDDLVRDSNVLEDYTHELLRTEDYEGSRCHVVRLTPKPDTPVPWGKVKMWIRAGDYLQLRVENYDQRGGLVNVMRLEDIADFGGRSVPSRITVVPADKENERTVLTYAKLEFDIPLEPGFFSQRNMRRLR